MEKFNLSIIDDEVSTLYNDMRGLVAIDGHNNVTEMYNLCRDCGIDIDLYFFVGFGFHIIDFSSSNINCYVYLIEKEKYGDNFDKISKKLLNAESTDIVKKSFSVEFNKLGKYIKRFDLFAVTEMSKYISNINIGD